MRTLQLTAVIEREGDGFVALCPELDVASQGDSRDEARANLREAVELLLETASASELARRLPADQTVERLEVTVAQAAGSFGCGGLPNPRGAWLFAHPSEGQPSGDAAGAAGHDSDGSRAQSL
jgi:predicted RNase H-like HicB family nuclease